MDRQNTLSTLWVFVMINMAFADILSLYLPGTIDQIATGTIDGITITPVFLLAAAGLIELGLVMIVLTRCLPVRAARIANLVAAPVTILFVVGGGATAPHYLLIGSFETIALILIFALAWGWERQRFSNPGVPA